MNSCSSSQPWVARPVRRTAPLPLGDGGTPGNGVSKRRTVKPSREQAGRTRQVESVPCAGWTAVQLLRHRGAVPSCPSDPLHRRGWMRAPLWRSGNRSRGVRSNEVRPQTDSYQPKHQQCHLECLTVYPLRPVPRNVRWMYFVHPRRPLVRQSHVAMTSEVAFASRRCGHGVSHGSAVHCHHGLESIVGTGGPASRSTSRTGISRTARSNVTAGT
jgi:hypothetical protein